MSNYFTYTGSRLNTISFPLGGIGTGCVGLSGTGRLVDWEIFNKPNKNSMLGFSHFAIKAEAGGQLLDSRVMNGDLPPPYMGGGMGPGRETLAGVPHFSKCEFQGEFPIARLTLTDRKFPGAVTVKAFNPFIPLNEDDSGIPAAFFEVEVKNPTKKKINYTLCLTVQNPLAGGTANTFAANGKIKQINLSSVSLPKEDVKYGDMTVATDAADVSYQEYWFRGAWFDNLGVYWRDLREQGKLKNRTYTPSDKAGGDHATLAAHVTAAPGKTVKARFVIAWNFPNCENYWNPVRCDSGACCNDSTKCGDGINHEANRWKNYYATLFADSKATANYCLTQWDRLESQTQAFKDALFGSDLPAAAIDAVSANISLLKSPTCLRIDDGTFYGWEGCHCNSGCCEGSCTHVWNYAYAMPFLFPHLERTVRDADFQYNYADDGSMGFRIQLPLGRARSTMRPCVDGQFCGVVKAYREWKICGDDAWLKGHWPKIKKNIEWAWSPENYDMWDRDKDGVLEGRQHHTLDVELFGPSSWLNSFYLAALKAGIEMAEYLGDAAAAAEYREVFDKGKAWVDKNLFNGEYYHQKIDVSDKGILDKLAATGLEQHKGIDYYWDGEHGQIKYQIDHGCALDQILGQWHANLCGLGDVLDPAQARKAAKSLYRYNFKKSMRDVFNACRIYSLNDEGGLMICEWPNGAEKPACPLTYAEETMNGFEYSGAITMIQYGLVKEGLEAVAAVRQRYNGENRNPWDEIECGHNYARSMASFALLPALSGFQFDMPRKTIGFNPVIEGKGGKFDCLWSLEGAWGMFRKSRKSVAVEVTAGKLTLAALNLPFLVKSKIKSVTLGKKKVVCTIEGGRLVFATPVTIDPKAALTVTM
ncbi:MAG: GH116 family glycosyl-hydrolase [Planctomycetaceae bacterium]|nr:non-lysosomal glucosylceramidase [Planctomycetaceae bacterium]